MGIGNFIIRRSKPIYRELVIHEKRDQLYWQAFQLYQSRIFGLCIYRTFHSDQELLGKIKEEQENG
jgi:hypothetical protein